MKLYIRNLVSYVMELHDHDSVEVLTKTSSLQVAAISLRDAANTYEQRLRDCSPSGKRVMLVLKQNSQLDDTGRWYRIATVYYDDDLGSIVMV